MSKPIIATYEASAHVSILITKISEKYRKYTKNANYKDDTRNIEWKSLIKFSSIVFRSYLTKKKKQKFLDLINFLSIGL